MSPHTKGKKGTHHTNIIYTVETREHSGGREQTRNYAQRQSGTTTNTRDTRACGQRKTAECTGLPTLAQSNKY